MLKACGDTSLGDRRSPRRPHHSGGCRSPAKPRGAHVGSWHQVSPLLGKGWSLSKAPFPPGCSSPGSPPSTPHICTLTRREDNHLSQTKGQSHGKAAAPQIWLLSGRAGPGRLLSSAGGQRGRQKLRLLLMSLLRADHRPLRPAVPEHGFLRNSFSCSHLIFLLQRLC